MITLRNLVGKKVPKLSELSPQIAVFLRGMEESGLVSDAQEKTHLIGFSLGAHVAGFAGSELKNISRITGEGMGEVLRKSRELTSFGQFFSRPQNYISRQFS